jgi:membrane-associated protein
MHSLGPQWMDPQYLLTSFGAQFFWLSALIVFIECGLLFPILPGDSLLFAVGLFISTGQVHVNIVLACVILSAAAFLGNVVGYEIGRAIGTPLYERDGRILKKKYFDQTTLFFDRHGNKALVIGRFVPIVRTFITVIAGVGRMNYRTYTIYSVIGGVLWGVGVTVLGYLLGGNAFVHDHIELILLGIVAVSLLPVGFEVLRHRTRTGTGAGTE